MMLRMLNRMHKRQNGFTAIEMVIGVTLIGIIGAALATGISQVYKGSALSSDRMTATNNVRNAVDWISQDARMAENQITITDNCPTINWTFYNPFTGDPPSEYEVIYTLSGTDLIRSYQVDDEAPTSMMVAQNITIDSAVFSANELSMTLTSTVNSVSETRTFVISLRNLPQ